MSENTEDATPAAAEQADPAADTTSADTPGTPPSGESMASESPDLTNPNTAPEPWNLVAPAYPEPPGGVPVGEAPPNTMLPDGRSFDFTKAGHLEAATELPDGPESLEPHPVQGRTSDPAGIPEQVIEEGGPRATRQLDDSHKPSADAVVSSAERGAGDRATYARIAQTERDDAARRDVDSDTNE